MLQSKKFSRVFHNVEDVVNFCYFNDLVRVVEYRDNFSDYYKERRAHRVGVRLGDHIEWSPWRGIYDGFDSIKPVYRADLSSKIDNAFEGII